jgi:hypothetical protein
MSSSTALNSRDHFEGTDRLVTPEPMTSNDPQACTGRGRARREDGPGCFALAHQRMLYWT